MSQTILQPTSHQQKGFTLLELMATIAVLAVLLGIGVPSFTEMVRNNRLSAQTNDFVAALNLARSEAVKRGLKVSVCPGVNDTCSGATDWNAGILVFTDDTGTSGVKDGTDEVLQSWPPYNNTFVAGGGASPASISFFPTEAEAPVQVDIYKSGCSGPNVHRITVARTGRIQSTKVTCS